MESFVATSWIVSISFFCVTNCVNRSFDGCILLVTSEDDHARTFILPENLLERPQDGVSHSLEPYADIQCGDSILAAEWAPNARLSDPASCAFLVAVRDHPLRLFNALNSTLVASFPIRDQYEQLRPVHCVAFTPDFSTYWSPNLLDRGSLLQPRRCIFWLSFSTLLLYVRIHTNIETVTGWLRAVKAVLSMFRGNSLSAIPIAKLSRRATTEILLQLIHLRFNMASSHQLQCLRTSNLDCLL